MKRFFAVLFLLILIPGAAFAVEKKVYGVYEHVLIPEISTHLIKAKLDTGAATSSLGVEEWSVFEKDGKEWVRFTPQMEGSKEVELPLLRYTKIKLRPAEGASGQNVRPVVRLEICFDGKTREVEVNLADRTNFAFPFLLGKSSLVALGIVVDPSSKYLSTPDCK